MLESALGGDAIDFGIGIRQQRGGFQEAHLHAEGSDRKSPVLVKQAVEVAAAAIKLSCQLSHRQIQEFVRLKSFEHLNDMVRRGKGAGHPGLEGIEFGSKDGADNSQHLGAMAQAELGGNRFRQLEALPGNRT